MRAINTKFATLSSTTNTVASFGIFGFLMGWVSRIFSGMCAPCDESFDLPDQFIEIDRFLNIPIATCFEGLFLVAAHDVRRQRQNGDTLKARSHLDLGS